MGIIGAPLCHWLLDRAIRVAKGETPDDKAPPTIRVGERGVIAAERVPDAVTRINLYARPARMEPVDEIDRFEQELQNRFGDSSPPMTLSGSTTAGWQRTLGAMATARELSGDRPIVSLTSGADDIPFSLVERLLSDIAT